MCTKISRDILITEDFKTFVCEFYSFVQHLKKLPVI